jgi:hypothetical protein
MLLHEVLTSFASVLVDAHHSHILSTDLPKMDIDALNALRKAKRDQKNTAKGEAKVEATIELLDIEVVIGSKVLECFQQEADSRRIATQFLIEELGFREELALTTMDNVYSDVEQEKQRYYGY